MYPSPTSAPAPKNQIGAPSGVMTVVVVGGGVRVETIEIGIEIGRREGEGVGVLREGGARRLGGGSMMMGLVVVVGMGGGGVRLRDGMFPFI